MNETINYGAVNKVEDKYPLLNGLNDRFAKNNAITNDLLNSVEDKLHLIVNKRAPSQKSDVKAEPHALPDMATQLDYNVSQLCANNGRLEMVLAHLCEII